MTLKLFDRFVPAVAEVMLAVMVGVYIYDLRLLWVFNDEWGTSATIIWAVFALLVTAAIIALLCWVGRSAWRSIQVALGRRSIVLKSQERAIYIAVMLLIIYGLTRIIT